MPALPFGRPQDQGRIAFDPEREFIRLLRLPDLIPGVRDVALGFGDLFLRGVFGGFGSADQDVTGAGGGHVGQIAVDEINDGDGGAGVDGGHIAFFTAFFGAPLEGG